MTKQPFYKSLYVQVLVAIAIGIALGHWYPETAVAMKPFGDGFVKLIKMAIAPIIFCTVVTGIAGMQSMKSVGKTGGMALLYFEVVSTVALIIGLVVVNVVQPGAGMHVDPNTLDTSKIAAYAAAGEKQSTVDFLMNVIPGTVVGAFANGDILQVLFFSVLFGYALHRLGSYGKPVFEFIERVSHVMFNIINVIMKVAPIGAQATDTPMDITHQITLLLVLLIASKGAAGVTGSGFIVLAATLSAVGHLPVAGLALILGIDRFMSEARALTNLVGNGVATVVVSKWCKQLDEGTLQRELAGEGNASSPASDIPVGGREAV